MLTAQEASRIGTSDETQLAFATLGGVCQRRDSGKSWILLPGPLSKQTVYDLHVKIEVDGRLWAAVANGRWFREDTSQSCIRQAAIGATSLISLGGISFADCVGILWMVAEVDSQPWPYGGLLGVSVFC